MKIVHISLQESFQSMKMAKKFLLHLRLYCRSAESYGNNDIRGIPQDFFLTEQEDDDEVEITK